MQFRPFLVLVAGLVLGASGQAADTKAGELNIAGPYARATVPGQPAGAAYVTIENTGRSTDKLVGATSPIAKSVEIHSMSMDGNVMKMREVPNIELKPSATVEMKPGQGNHLMLVGLNKPLKAGDSFPLTLTFEKAGKVDVSVKVEGNGARAPVQNAGAHQKH
jgi:copper(I)-binding protein